MGDVRHPRTPARAATVALTLALAGCAGSATPPPTTVTQTVVTSPGAPTASLGMVDQLRAAGANEASVRALAVVARRSGYMWRSRPFTSDEANTFAYMALLECREIASGERTWEESWGQAAQDDASAADATRVTAYLRSS
jgi:hypothetical protein